MDITKLKELEDKFKRNKKGLGFQVNITMDETDAKRYHVSFQNLDNRYKDALKRLVSQMLKEAQDYIVEEFKIDVLKEDEEMEYLRFEKTLYKEMHLLLNSLCNYGLDTFLKNVAFLSTKYKQLYELANARLKDGVFVDRYGNRIA